MTQELHYTQIPMDFGFFTKKTFDNFIVGENKKLFNSLIDFQNSDQIILLYGSKSSGKSHICEAILNECDGGHILVNDRLKLINLTLTDYYSLVVIDDLDKLAVSKECEEKLFTIINNQILNKKPVLVTSSKDINECNLNLKDLSSRLSSDKIFTISDLDDSDKINMMISYCSQRGLEIPDKVLSYIINNCSRDIYFICALIKSIDSASMSTKKKITIPFIKKVLQLLNN